MRACWLLLAAFSAASCLDPTEITVEVTTNFDCPNLRTGLLVGGIEALSVGPFAATKDSCMAQRVGELVVVPRRGLDASVYVRVLAAVDGTPLDVCQDDASKRPVGSKCIEAKRIVRFVRHTRLRIPVVLTQSCINVNCGDKTCDDGKCIDPCTDAACVDAGPPPDSGPPIPTLLAAGFENACAVITGKLQCWGANDTKQLGPAFAGDPVTTIPMPMDFGAIQEIAIGGGHICTSNGSRIVCVGNNTAGQLGRGTQGTVESSPADAKAPNGMWTTPLRWLVAQNSMTCVLSGKQTLCFGEDGWNFHGGMAGGVARDPGFDMIAAGRSHTCGVSMGNIYCWGDNTALQIGASPTDQTTPNLVPNVAGADWVGAGFDHSAVRQMTQVSLWGRNADGEVNPNIANGFPQSAPQLVTPSVLPIVIGEKHVCILDGTKVRCRGASAEGQIGPMAGKSIVWYDVPIGEPATNIAAGRAHTCALGASKAVYCWGAAPAGSGGNQPKRIAL